ncbi:hypothetical protein KR044_013085 [Drosophila immigrans]|nr:hypothetical protein KR044_013085 [Drosophila immigrans]
MEPKFVLPSPNFNKNSKEPKNNLHYLTPCGMTLLPRSKQPPPMYGARGSTVPAKYLKPEQPQLQKTLEASPPVRTEFCGNCDMGLANAQDMRRHLEQHEDCPAEGCEFAALTSVLDKHIEANHITGLYKTVKKAWTPEEIAAWRAERRKRFPTTANVELAKRAKEQRQKRGERLEASKARFGKVEDRHRARPKSNYNRERAKPNKRHQNNANRTENRKTQMQIDPVEEDAEASRKFRGTSQMKDYKHVKEKTQPEVNALSNMLGMYGSDSEYEATTDEEVADEAPEVAVEVKPAEVDETTRNEVATEAPCEEDKQKERQSVDKPVQFAPDSEMPQETPQSSDDEAPDEAPIERKTEVEKPHELAVESKPEAPAAEPTAEAKPQPEHKTNPKRAAAKKRVLGLNFKRARLMTKQNTMLSKLLESDIRHERNVLLQCVRYVCEQNFFGIGSSSSSSSTSNTS